MRQLKLPLCAFFIVLMMKSLLPGENLFIITNIISNIVNASLRSHFPAYAGTRAIIRIQVNRIADSCGHGVPLYEFQNHRDTLPQWAEKLGVDGIKKYHTIRNHTSIDGLAGL